MAGIFQQGCWSFGFDSTTAMSQIFSNGPIATVDTASARFPAVAGAVSMGSTWSINHTGILPLGIQLVSMISGIAFKLNTGLPIGQTQCIYQYYDSVANSPQLSLCVNAQGAIEIRRGTPQTGTVLATSASGVVAANTYYYFECGATISSTVGAVTCYLNGVPGGGTPVVQVTGANTKNTANTWIDEVQVGSLNNSYNVMLDDWYMLDLTGAAPNNTYLGDKKIITVLPSADSATPGLNQFSTQPSQTATNHWQNVDEVPPDDATSYNFSATPGDRESYRHAALSLGNISFLNTRARISKDDAVARSASITCRSGSTDSIGTAISVPSSFTTFNLINTVDPATGVAWTNGGVNGQESGLEIIS
jgi:hypothetical protein